MIKTLRAADLAAGVFLTFLSLLILVAAFQIAGIEGDRLHPRTLPVILGWMLLVGAVALAINGFRHKGEPTPVEWPERSDARRVLVTLVAIVAYMATLDFLGFPLSTVVFVSLMSWYLGRYRWWASALIGMASGSTVLIVFNGFLGLSFPLGLLELL